MDPAAALFSPTSSNPKADASSSAWVYFAARLGTPDDHHPTCCVISHSPSPPRCSEAGAHPHKIRQIVTKALVLNSYTTRKQSALPSSPYLSGRRSGSDVGNGGSVEFSTASFFRAWKTLMGSNSRMLGGVTKLSIHPACPSALTQRLHEDTSATDAPGISAPVGPVPTETCCSDLPDVISS